MSKIRKLTADEIECRVAQVGAKGVSLLLYKTARTDKAILDETYGDLWQNDFKPIDGKMYGGIGVYNKDLKEWLWRWDCGTESNTEAEKGQASDCFKRAGFKWGIGVELYTSPFIFVPVETVKDERGKYQMKDRFLKFVVQHIAYNNDRISELVIVDEKGNQWFSWKEKGVVEKKPTKQAKEKTAEEEKKEEQAETPKCLLTLSKFREKMNGIKDGSIDISKPENQKKIQFVSDLKSSLISAGYDEAAELLEKDFNKKLFKEM